MAFRSLRIDESEADPDGHSGVSLAGIAILQSKMNKSWRPMQADDLGETRSIGDNSSFQLTNVNGHRDATVESELQQPFVGLQSKLPAVSDAGSTRDTPAGTYKSVNDVEITTFAGVRAKYGRQGEAQFTTEATRVRLFGNLPDPIRLSEQMGKFDGQVVFIGHPNQDVSAHEWSSSSLLWVNIGRYSHSRGKVEGSLASDRLRGTSESHDTIEYFKLAAENRQALILENGRPKSRTAVTEAIVHGSVDLLGRSQVSKDDSIKTFRITDQTQREVRSSFGPTTHSLLKGDVLEDPFVVEAGVPLVRSTNGNKFQNNVANSSGSMDLTYRFPTKASADRSSANGSSAFGFKNMSCSSRLSSTSRLQEVAFGEEAATRRTSLLAQDERFHQLCLNTSQQAYHENAQPSKMESSRQMIPWYKDIASNIGMSSVTARPSAPIRSVVSTKYTTSNLNATAVPYSRAPPGLGMSGIPESGTGTVNADGVALHYSDPDGLRKTQQYEVADGLTQQAPTVQCFKGPFFTDSKPTAHDPTASLSVHVSEEEKLTNWFRDGHRAARQKEYTKSLIAAAVASDKSRHFGAPGEMMLKSEDGRYAHTGPFVRLFENLSEYVEEHGHGGGESYFTRRWKPAARQQRESGVEQGVSYFGKGGSRGL